MKIMEQPVPVFVSETYFVNHQLNRVVKGIQNAARRKKLTVRMTSSLPEVIGWCKSWEISTCIVLCYSLADASEIARTFYTEQIHPIFTNMQPDSPYPYSCVTQDYFDACSYVVEVIADMRGKVAYVGKNPDSYTDALRYKEVELALREYGRGCDVYSNSGSINACIDAFLSHADEYAAVICANDNVAVLLSRKFAHPEEHNIMSFGGIIMSEHINGITSVGIDYFGVGEHAVEVFSLLSKSRGIRSVIMTVTDAKGREKLIHGSAAADSGRDERIDFYDDEEVRRTSALENLLANCDEVDKQILISLLNGESYASIEENSYISLHTIKYRINKMIERAEVADKNALLSLLRNYDIRF